MTLFVQLRSIVGQPRVTNVRTLESTNQRRSDFYRDRPLMLMQNRQDVPRLVDYFHEEVQELNGKGQEGIFAKDQFREDYRQQEVSDIVIYALSIFETLGIEPNFDHIRMQIAEVSLENNIKPVSEETPLGPVMLFDGGLENGPKAAKYEQLKHTLKETAAQISASQSNEVIVKALEQVIAISFNIYYLIGVPPLRSIEEKLSRNMLKYIAELFSIAYLQMASLNGEVITKDNFRTAKYDPEKLSEVFARQRAIAIDQFDGPKDENGVRPLTGTNDFYGLYERLMSQS